VRNPSAASIQRKELEHRWLPVVPQSMLSSLLFSWLLLLLLPAMSRAAVEKECQLNQCRGILPSKNSFPSGTRKDSARLQLQPPATSVARPSTDGMCRSARLAGLSVGQHLCGLVIDNSPLNKKVPVRNKGAAPVNGRAQRHFRVGSRDGKRAALRMACGAARNDAKLENSSKKQPAPGASLHARVPRRKPSLSRRSKISLPDG